MTKLTDGSQTIGITMCIRGYAGRRRPDISAPYPRTRIGRIIRDFQLSEVTLKAADMKGFQRNYLG